jgi:hypothetical protein
VRAFVSWQDRKERVLSGSISSTLSVVFGSHSYELGVQAEALWLSDSSAVYALLSVSSTCTRFH